MQEVTQVGVTKDQKALLLQGLRYVRSSVKLDMRFPSAEADAERAAELGKIESLIAQISSATSMSTADC